MTMCFYKNYLRICPFALLLAMLLTFGLGSCLREPDFEAGRFPDFSSDTLSFDTVFTTLGSTTEWIRLINPFQDGIEIERLYLQAGSSSHFRINLDGKPGISFEHVKLRGKDSLYLFCELTINPDDPLEQSPFIILDSVILESGGLRKALVLQAYGQNANYFPSKSAQRQILSIDLQGATLRWNDPKPYVVYGVLYLDHGTLEIAEGSRVHFFGGVASFKNPDGQTLFYNDGRLIIGSDANIRILGTPENRVLITGARLESGFQNIPGQWSGIAIDKYSKGNLVRCADIRNSLQGLFLDSLSECVVDQSVFSFQSYTGISSYSSELRLTNSLFYEQNSSSLLIENGGKIYAAYNTFANLGNDEPAVLISNQSCIDPPFCLDLRKHPLEALFLNCVISGSNADELWIIPDVTTPFDLKLDHCLMRIKELVLPKQFPKFMEDYTSACVFHQDLDGLFRDYDRNDFRLDSLSVAEKKAIPIQGLDKDLNQFLRDAQTPDIGCYEYEK